MGKQVAPVIDAECPDLSRTAPQRVEAEKDDGRRTPTTTGARAVRLLFRQTATPLKLSFNF